jgi:hypothetical protein
MSEWQDPDDEWVGEDELVGEDGPCATPTGLIHTIRKGKYKGLVLTGAVSVKPDRQQKVDALKAQIILDGEVKKRGADLAFEWLNIREEEDVLKGQLKEVSLRKEAVAQILAEQYDAEGTSSLTIAGIGVVRVDPEPYASVQDPEALREWCLKQAALSLKMKLSWPTVNALVKERALMRAGPPPGVNVFMRNKLVRKLIKGADLDSVIRDGTVRVEDEREN